MADEREKEFGVVWNIKYDVLLEANLEAMGNCAVGVERLRDVNGKVC